MPYIYAPIVATIALYPNARDTLSMNVTTKFVSWATTNSDLRLSLQPKIAGMVPIVNEGLLSPLGTTLSHSLAPGSGPGPSAQPRP